MWNTLQLLWCLCAWVEFLTYLYVTKTICIDCLPLAIWLSQSISLSVLGHLEQEDVKKMQVYSSWSAHCHVTLTFFCIFSVTEVAYWETGSWSSMPSSLPCQASMLAGPGWPVDHTCIRRGQWSPRGMLPLPRKSLCCWQIQPLHCVAGLPCDSHLIPRVQRFCRSSSSRWVTSYPLAHASHKIWQLSFGRDCCGCSNLESYLCCALG